MKFKIKKEPLIEIIVSIFLTITTFLISKYICQPVIFGFANSKVSYYFIRLTFLITFFFVYLFLIDFIKKVINKSAFHKKWLKHTMIYLIFMSIFLLLVFPGHWVWDEFSLIEDAINSRINVWHSYITIILITYALMIIPFPVGVVIFQIVAISIIFGYLAARLDKTFKKPSITILSYILFLLPAVLVNNVYPLRLPMYAYANMLFFVIVLFDYINKENITLKKFFILFILMSLIITWRSEGIICLLFLPVIIFFTYRKNINISKCFFTFIALCVVYVGYSKGMNLSETVKNFNTKYSLTIYVNPLSMMLQDELKGENLDRDLENIDKVISIDALRNNPSYIEIPSFWKDGTIRDGYKEHLKDFKISYINIILNNPMSFIKARMKTFLASNGMDKDCLGASYGSFTQYYNIEEIRQDFIYEHIISLPYMEPINNEIRTTIITKLLGLDLDYNKNNLVWIIFWNSIPTIILLTLVMIIKFFKKEYIYSIIGLLVLAKTAIIYLTAPGSYFMYFLPDYLIGFVVLLIMLGSIKKKESTINDIKENNEVTAVVNKEKKIKAVIIQALKFFCISGVAWLIDMTVFSILCTTDMNAGIVNIISSVCGATFTYVVSTRKMFRNNAKLFNVKTKYIIYISYQILFILLTSFIISKINNFLYLNVQLDIIVNYSKIIVKVFVTPFTMIINFIVMKCLMEKI